MKRFLPLSLFGVLLVGCSWWPREFVENPDPNHTHADFAVWVNGEKLNFSADELMSGGSTEEEGEDGHGHAHLHPYLHLHDGVGHVIHRHKPGLTLKEFFDSLQVGFDEKCYGSFAPMADGFICGETLFRMFMNGKEQPFDLEYAFSDTDQILLTNTENDAEVTKELEGLTDDACLYSRTCPWRGEAPKEGCIADPAVPCIEALP